MNNTRASNLHHSPRGLAAFQRHAAAAPRRLPLSIALAAALSLLHQAPSQAATYTWTGAADGVWNRGTNWTVPCRGSDGNMTTCIVTGENGPFFNAFPAGSELLFNGNTNTSISALPSGNLLEVSFTFGSNAAAYTFNPGGDGALALKGNIKNNSSKLQTFNFRFDPRSDQTWDGGSGGLQLWNFGDLNNALTLKNHVNLINFKNVSSKVGTTGVGSLSIGSSSRMAAAELIVGEQLGSDGLVALSASDAQLNLGGSLYLGRGGNGMLNITGGQTTAYQAFLGFNFASQGTALVDGASSKLAITADLDVGHNSTGTLTVQNGGFLSSGNSFIGRALGGDGLVQLSGAGSSWLSSGTLTVGDAGIGSLQVLAGAKLSNVSAVVGNQAGSIGSAKVSGSASSWLLSGDLQVGNLGEGSLYLEQGGQVSSRHSFLGTIGDPGSSRMVVSGTGSRLQNSGTLSVQSGQMDIRDGGQVLAQEMRFAEFDGSSAVVNLSGEGASLSAKGDLRIASNDGVATVNLGTGASINSAGRLQIGKNGVLNLNGGTLVVGWANNAGQVNWNTGTVHFLAPVISGVGGILGNSVGLGQGMNIVADAALIIELGDDLSLNGGNVQAYGVRVEGDMAVGSFSQLSVGAEGTRINGALQMTGGRIVSAGEMVNAGSLSGYGTLAGSDGFSNTGLLRQGDGNLILNNSGVNVNSGSWALSAGRSLVLQASELNNSGGLSLNGGFISGDGALINDTQGSISGSGRISTVFLNRGSLLVDGGRTQIDNSFTNRGQILLIGSTATLAGGQIGNHGLIQGQGKVNNDISNIDPIGTIEAQGGTLTLAGRIVSPNSGSLIAGSGAKLLVNQGLSNNAGQIQLAGGTFDNNGHSLVNQAGGSINGFGTLRAALLNNQGQIFLSGGTSALRADVLAAAGSQIILSGLSNTTFYGTLELLQGSELRVTEGSAATFAAEVKQRNGSNVNGDGKMFFEGGLSIGNSPGYGYIQGSVTFASSNTYTAEIGGVLPCTTESCAPGSPLVNDSFDKLAVGGNLRLGGKLVLTSWNGFVAQAGQSFDLLDWGGVSGVFNSIDASGFKLAAGTQLDYSQLYTSGTVQVTAVPEPERYALLLSGLCLLAWRRRKLD